MKVAFVVFSVLIASTVGGEIELPDFGSACQLTDRDCCINKFELLGELVLRTLGNLVVPKLESSINYGCCKIKVIATNIQIVGVDGIALKDFKINVGDGTVELVLESAQFNISTGYDVTGTCNKYLGVSAIGKALLEMNEPSVKLIVKVALGKGLLKVVSVRIQPTVKGITILLSNPPNQKLQNLLNKIPLSEKLVIFKNVFETLIGLLEKLLFGVVEKVVNGLAVALLFIIKN